MNEECNSRSDYAGHEVRIPHMNNNTIGSEGSQFTFKMCRCSSVKYLEVKVKGHTASGKESLKGVMSKECECKGERSNDNDVTLPQCQVVHVLH